MTINTRHIFLTLTACLLSSATTAQAQHITIEKDTLNCGKTGYQQPVKATFTLKWTGNMPLVIKDVVADCGCTTVDAPKGVATGQQFSVTMTYDARQLGHYQKQCALYSNAQAEPLYLTMRGQVLADVYDYSGDYPYDMAGLRCDQQELFFDDVQRGETPVAILHVVNDGNRPMMPNLLHMPPYLTAVCTPEQIRPNERATISVTLNSERLHDYGLTQTSIYLAQQLGDKVSSDNEMTVSAVLLPTISETSQTQSAPNMRLSTTDLNLGSFGTKKKLKGSIDIENTGQGELDISSLQLFNRGLRITLPKQKLKPGEKTRLKVTAVADELSRSRTKPRILMITNDPHQPKVIIRVTTTK